MPQDAASFRSWLLVRFLLWQIMCCTPWQCQWADAMLVSARCGVRFHHTDNLACWVGAISRGTWLANGALDHSEESEESSQWQNASMEQDCIWPFNASNYLLSGAFIHLVGDNCPFTTNWPFISSFCCVTDVKEVKWHLHAWLPCLNGSCEWKTM